MHGLRLTPIAAGAAASSSPTQAQLGSYLALLAATGLWGAQFAAGKMGVTALPAFALAFGRNAIAALIFTALALRHKDGLRVRRADLWAFALIAVAGSAMNQAAMFSGLRLAPASDGALLQPSSAPLFASLLLVLLGRELLTRRHALGTLISLAGVALVFVGVNAGQPAAAGPGADRLLGDLCFLASGVAFGFYVVIGAPLFTRYGALKATAIVFLLSLLPLAALAGFSGDGVGLLSMTSGDVLIMLFMGIFGSFGPFMLFNSSVPHVGPGAASRFGYLMPVWGLAISVPLLGERPSALQVLGGGLMVAGVWLSTSARPKTTTPSG